jgi:hypothetical protein
MLFVVVEKIAARFRGTSENIATTMPHPTPSGADD